MSVLSFISILTLLGVYLRLSTTLDFDASFPLSCAVPRQAAEYAQSTTHASLLRGPRATRFADLLVFFPPRDRDLFLPFRRGGAV